MFGIDWLQLIQVISVLLLTMSFTLYIIVSIRKNPSTIFRCSLRLNAKILPDFSEQMTVEDYDSFHKYEIWRFYRFSQSDNVH